MDNKPLVYHPNRTLAFYRRPDLEHVADGQRQAIAKDRTAALFTVLEWAELEEDATATENGVEWQVTLQANHVEHAFFDFWRAGRQIFDMSRMTYVFKHTDVDAIVPGELKLPFDNFYLHFGDVGLGSPFADTPIEGCYVQRCGPEDRGRNAIVLTVVCRHPDLFGMLTAPLEEAATQFGRGYVIDVALDEPVGVGLVLDGSEDEELWHPYLMPVVRLAMNSLCYLAYPERDVESDFHPGAPARLVEQTKSSSRREAQRAESKLASLGYTRVHFCGHNTFPEPSASQKGGEIETPHWRRGHWRNQAHGAGRRDHKLIFIAPTMVRADLGDPIPHVYDVDTGEPGGRGAPNFQR